MNSALQLDQAGEGEVPVGGNLWVKALELSLSYGALAFQLP